MEKKRKENPDAEFNQPQNVYYADCVDAHSISHVYRINIDKYIGTMYQMDGGCANVHCTWT